MEKNNKNKNSKIIKDKIFNSYGLLKILYKFIFKNKLIKLNTKRPNLLIFLYVRN